MSKNRLKLDFTLNTTEERSQFVNNYVHSITFTPNAQELEIMANYILWGKDPKTGLNVKQSHEIQLESKAGTWDARQDESLDALLETPAFNESMLKTGDKPRSKPQRVVFSREDARATAPPHILNELEHLWHVIDELDLTLNFYDLKTGKRKQPPRADLLNKFTPEKINELKQRANSFNQFYYLKMRHLLVDLRRQQFTLKDEYATTILCVETLSPAPSGRNLDTEVPCAPIGLKYNNPLNKKIFPDDRFPLPSDFTEDELMRVAKLYYNKFNMPNTPMFDFRQLEHIYQALLLFFNIEDDARENTLSTSSEFLDTLNFYIHRANLSNVHQDILFMKMNHRKNQEVADYVNKKHSKSYTANYISTIFRQKIIPQINRAARQHADIIENLCFPENWKQCKRCGATLLINTDNFVRKARSSDGFSSQCKRCDKEKRKLRR